MEVLQQHEKGYLDILPWKNSNVVAGFSTRQNGFSQTPYDSMNLGVHVQDRRENVLQNRKRFSQWIERDLKQWKSLNQIHSRNILDLTEPHYNEEDLRHDAPQVDGDGMITNNPDHVLTAYYADCVPLIFRTKQDNWIGIAHAGWKGTVKQIGPHMIERFKHKGINPEDIEVVIGPCISQSYYEIDAYVIQHIPKSYQTKVLTPTTENHGLLDLKRLNFLYLVDDGVKEENIHITDYCTYRDQSLFYSHRRDQGQTGRMMAFIYRK
ncbi:peptidoglycan editing factor PgeF [Tenuibacillus multivorans]|uniref:Purine nucleoside phosphorylase n=1 Tax=Tenuibacillus multivorans TaxID=237069 RepID=A0A1G9Y5I3_9BACI|nr:peptidoglycan editing factor PgeF [Tenuibacillus multivorans]GEL75957.1 laccase domain protein YlmD [Tenuibacillus multivorans]SDN04354.1 conserved hypothetical protein [Tenuibacillus multivorans]